MKTVYVEAVVNTLDIVTSANMRTTDVESLVARLEKATGAKITVSDKLEGMEYKSFSAFVSAFQYWNSPAWAQFAVDENGKSFADPASFSWYEA